MNLCYINFVDVLEIKGTPNQNKIIAKYQNLKQKVLRKVL